MAALATVPFLPPAPPPLEGALEAIEAIATAQTQQTAPVGEQWITTWGTTLLRGIDGCCNNQTLRMFMRASVGGQALRVRLSNAQGTVPLYLGEVHVALRDLGSEIVEGSDRRLTFGNRTAVEIPVGAEVTSDAVKLDVPALADLAISVYAPNQTGLASVNNGNDPVGYVVSGNHAGTRGLTGATLQWAVHWVSGIEVLAAADAKTVLVVTDPTPTRRGRTTLTAHQTWPSLRSARLQKNQATRDVAVITTSDSERLMDRRRFRFPNGFHQIVGRHLGVRQLLLCPDFTTVVFPVLNEAAAGRIIPASIPDTLTKLFSEVIAQARARNIATIGCTMNPALDPLGAYRVGPGNDQPIDAIRVAVNEWIRSSGAFDAVVDFDAIARNPAQPDQLKPEFQLKDFSGGQPERTLGWSVAGHQALADSVDLSLFAR